MRATMFLDAHSTQGDQVPFAVADMLFGNMPSSDLSDTVVRRIRAAIGLGLLKDGQKLPKEAELAKRFGISSSTLREALGVLRTEDLIETRAGKYGGSFVKHPKEIASLARDELARMSFTELRDLGDWRQMLVTQSAGFAARRASAADVARLAGYADQVAAAHTAEQARRAHGRFHLVLAAAGQSMRLNKAEFVMHEELDWLFGLVLDTDEKRQLDAAELRAIVDEVRAQNVERASASAARHSINLVEELARLRLAIIAARQSASPAETGAKDAQSLATEIGNFTEGLVDQLRTLAATAAPILGEGTDERKIRARISLSIMVLFEDVPSYVQGLGINADVGVVPEHPYWINWWRPSGQELVEDTSHVMDPDDENFYDYEAREYMAHPREHLEEWAAGPYVDYGGVNDYAITISAPIVYHDRFLGVAAVDVLVADLEHRFSSWLAAIDETCVLLNAENRVVISNSAGYNVGDVVKTAPSDRVVPLNCLGWSVMTNHSRTNASAALPDPVPEIA